MYNILDCLSSMLYIRLCVIDFFCYWFEREFCQNKGLSFFKQPKREIIGVSATLVGVIQDNQKLVEASGGSRETILYAFTLREYLAAWAVLSPWEKQATPITVRFRSFVRPPITIARDLAIFETGHVVFYFGEVGVVTLFLRIKVMLWRTSGQ